MYFQDLTPCRYHGGEFDAENWRAPLLAVGWLEAGHDFSTGTSSEDLCVRLTQMMDAARVSYPHYQFRGLHGCSFCDAGDYKSIGYISSLNAFIPGADVVYVAPGGIVHYIEKHRYLPPEEFIRAVMECPPYGSAEYRAALERANRGAIPPLLRPDASSAEILLTVWVEHLRSLSDPDVAPAQRALAKILRYADRRFDARYWSDFSSDFAAIVQDTGWSEAMRRKLERNEERILATVRKACEEEQ